MGLKIAMFHLGFFYSGGGEKLVLEEIRGLRALGHEVSCFAPYIDRRGCYPDIPEMREIEPLLPPPPAWLPVKDPLWVTLSCLMIPLLAYKFRRFDVFLGANQPGPWFAFALSRLLRKPYVIYLAQPLRILHPRTVDLENGIRIHEEDARFIAMLTRVAGAVIDWIDRLSVTSADTVLTNGEHVGRWIKRVYGVENEVCAGGCHPLPAHLLSYETRWKGFFDVAGVRIPKPFILLTNRHSPMKRFEYAVWALKTIVRSTRRVRLVITGQETVYTDQLRYLVDGLGLSDYVHFVGLVNETDLRQLYMNAAVYVYPSPEEDFGMGVVEAMAAGTPVVAWNNGGPTVTVQDGITGFLVEPYDTHRFADRLLRLVTSRVLAEKLGRAGYERASRFFSYERHNAQLAGALCRSVGTQVREPEGASAAEAVRRVTSFGEPLQEADDRRAVLAQATIRSE